jgi:hypothetical protein
MVLLTKLANLHKNNLAYVVDLPYNMGIRLVQTGFKFAKKTRYQIALLFDGDGQHLIAEIKDSTPAQENRIA